MNANSANAYSANIRGWDCLQEHTHTAIILLHILSNSTKPGTNFVPVMPRNIARHVTHKLRTIHEMRDTQCHECALNSFVMTSRDTLQINF